MNTENLSNLIDTYLIRDLKTLIEEIGPRKEGGGVGYPAIHTLISGMELLGLLMSGEEKEKAFNYFWEEYLQKFFPEYNNDGLRNIFRNVVRNGTAHIFMVKSGVSISKDNSNHLKFIKINGENYLNIDLKILHNHFLKCYDEIKKDLVKINKFEKGYQNFNGQMKYAKEQVENLFYTTKEIINKSTTTTSSTGYPSTDFIIPNGISGTTTLPPNY